MRSQCLSEPNGYSGLWVRTEGIGVNPARWRSRTLCGRSRCAEDPLAKKLKASAAVHLAFQRFQPVDLPLRLAAAPRLL